MTRNAFRVLVVDDETRILNFLKAKLKVSGYEVFTATNGQEALEIVHTEEPDLIVLDLLMPKMNGFDMLRQLRTFSSVPVIILSAKGANGDKIQGLTMGADDYLPKPFNPDELVARIEAVRRRLKPETSTPTIETFSLGNATVDFKKHVVVVNGQEKYLTRIEWLLLSELSHNAGRLMPYEELLSRVWGPEYRNDVQLLRTWISRLRYKLEDTPSKPKLISTVPKTGYMINEPAAS